MSESEQDFRTPRLTVVGDPAKLAGLERVDDLTKAARLAAFPDSTKLAGVARLAFDETKLAALENVRAAMKVSPGVAGLAESAKLSGLANLRNRPTAGLADLQKRLAEAGISDASVKAHLRRLDRIADQAARVERLERSERVFDAMKARNRIDDQLREAGLRQARKAAALEAAQLGTLDELVALNGRIDGLADAISEVVDESRQRAERDGSATRWLVWLAAATVILTAVVVGLTLALLVLTL